MVRYTSNPNYKVSVAGKFVKFNALGFAYINSKEVMDALDKLPNVTKDVLETKPELPKEEKKPTKKKKKK